MGWFDRFRKKTLSPDELRQRLFDAADDPSAFAALCDRHEGVLEEHAPAWAKVPEPLRADPEAMQRYAQMLIRLAQHLAERGHPALLSKITGGGGANPLTAAQDRVAEAQTLMHEARFEDALAMLDEVRTAMARFEGPGRDHLETFLDGFSGQCLFQLGRVREAIEPLERAQLACLEGDDDEGAIVYAKSLFGVHRYLADADAAADHAEDLAEMLQSVDPTASDRYAGWADIVRRGEPLNRVVAVLDDAELELDALPPIIEGPCNFIFVRNRPTLACCARLVDRGRRLGSEGDLDAAAAAFIEATEQDVHAPEPWHELAFTRALQGRFEEAVEAYDRTEELAPGWFHSRQERYMANLYAKGSLPGDLHRLLVELQDGAGAPADKLAVADAALADHPDVALLHLHRGIALTMLDRPSDAAASLRRGLEAALTNPAIETRLFARLASVTEDPAERQQAIDAAIERDGDRIAGAVARLLRRASSH